jgi:hypothetical protein
MRTTNGGESWIPLDAESVTSLYSVFVINETIVWVCGQFGTILTTTNQGNTWSMSESSTGNQLLSIAFGAPQNGWIVGQHGTLLQTNDAGTHWNLQTAGVRNSLKEIIFVNATEGWIVGYNGLVLHSVTGFPFSRPVTTPSSIPETIPSIEPSSSEFLQNVFVVIFLLLCFFVGLYLTFPSFRRKVSGGSADLSEIDLIRARNISADENSILIELEIRNKKSEAFLARKIHVSIHEISKELLVASGEVWERFVFPGDSLGRGRLIHKKLELSTKRNPVFRPEEQYRVIVQIDLAVSDHSSLISATDDFIW